MSRVIFKEQVEAIVKVKIKVKANTKVKNHIKYQIKVWRLLTVEFNAKVDIIVKVKVIVSVKVTVRIRVKVIMQIDWLKLSLRGSLSSRLDPAHPPTQANNFSELHKDSTESSTHLGLN